MNRAPEKDGQDMDHTLDVLDDIMQSILRLASPQGHQDGALKLVCKRWRKLLCASYKRVRLLELAPSVGATLRTLRTYQNLTHVKLKGRLSGDSENAKLLKRLATEEGMPLLRSFHLDFVYHEGAFCKLAYFLSRRTSLQTLQLTFCMSPGYNWQEIHSRLENLDFRVVSRLEHLTLSYKGLYGHLHRDECPDEGCYVPLSWTLVSRQRRQKQLLPELKTFHLQLPSLAQVQNLPPGLEELHPFSSLAITLSGHNLRTPAPSEWFLLRTLAAMSSLQELSLKVDHESFGAYHLATLAKLHSLKRLHLCFGYASALPEVSRPFARLEEFELTLEWGSLPPGPLPRDFFKFTPNLHTLKLYSRVEVAWPALACLTRLTSLTVDIVDPDREDIEGSFFCCDVGSLPALQKLELGWCRLLPAMEGLTALGDTTAVSCSCWCKDGDSPIIVRSFAEYVRSRCSRLTHGGARRVFQDSRRGGRVVPEEAAG